MMFYFLMQLIVTQEVEVKAHIQHNDDSVLDLNRIQLIEEKASGQFGTLWKAVQEDKEVAVKIFTKEVCVKFTFCFFLVTTHLFLA